jgi:O-antigen/teichoic acid export membrane protein
VTRPPGLFRNAIALLATSAVAVPVTLLTTVLLTRLLELEEFGVYSVTLNFAATLGVIGTLGWPAAAIYRLRRAGSEPGTVFTSALVATVGISIAILAAAGLFESEIRARFLPGATPLMFWIGMGTVPAQLSGGVAIAIARASNRFDLHNAYRLLRTFGMLAVAAILLGALGRDLTEILWGVLAVQVVATAIVWIAVARVTGVRAASLGEMRAAQSFGARSWVNEAAVTLHQRVDLFLIAWLLADPAQLALYGIAVRVIERLKLIPGALATSLMPQAAGLPEEQAGRLSAAVCRHTAFWVVSAALGIGVLAPWLVPLLFGEAFADAVVPVWFLLGSMSMFAVYQVLTRYFIAVGRQRVNIITQLGALALNLALNVTLIPRLGIDGAALASLLSHTTAAVGILVAFRRDSGQRLADVLIPRADDLDEYRRRIAPLLARVRPPRS